MAHRLRARAGLAIAGRIGAALALGPEPHPYRRIKREGDTLRLAVKDWPGEFLVSFGR
ncbi:MAG: hypothetical protein KGL25_05455 [Gammaproteobacteria bacterium]|nr:hypothetical protein [Gammaproteobacteria bacterium]